MFNTDVDQALGAVQAALRGETEQIRQYGVSLDDATVKQKAVEMGLADSTGEVDKNAKAVAALELIYEQTAKVQGDFADTSTDLANAQRIAAAEWENAKARFGSAAAAPLANLTNFATDALLSFQALGGDEVAQKSLRFAEAMETIRNASDEIESGNIAAVGDAILHMATNSDLAAGDVQALGAAAGLSVEEIEHLGEVMLQRGEEMGFSKEILQELNDAFFTTPEAADAAAGGIEEVGAEADETKEKIEAAKQSFEEYLDALAESTNSALKAVNSLDDLSEAQAKVSELSEAGKEDTDEFRLAQLELAAQVFETEQALNEFSGKNVEDSIGAIATALGVSFTEAQTLLEELGLLDGLTVSSVVDVKFIASGNKVAQNVFDAGGKIAGVTIDGVTFKASGGPVYANQPYIVGEQGSELFIPKGDGTIIPNGGFAPMGGWPSMGGGGVNITVNYPEHRSDDLLGALQTATTLIGLTRYAETSPGRS